MEEVAVTLSFKGYSVTYFEEHLASSVVLRDKLAKEYTAENRLKALVDCRLLADDLGHYTLWMLCADYVPVRVLRAFDEIASVQHELLWLLEEGPSP